MLDIGEKILSFIVSEVVEGLIFGFCLYIALTFPNDNVRLSIVNSIIILWTVTGIGTPVAIFTELGEILSHLRKDGAGRE